jgi:hypothetical protein
MADTAYPTIMVRSIEVPRDVVAAARDLIDACAAWPRELVIVPPTPDKLPVTPQPADPLNLLCDIAPNVPDYLWNFAKHGFVLGIIAAVLAYAFFHAAAGLARMLWAVAQLGREKWCEYRARRAA